ncbi:MAG: SusD/RagB family nutrient-binding outer membrane lipoprotein [Ferruginibacter sp.]
MKVINLKTACVSTAILALVNVSCKKSDFAINTNPNAVTASTVNFTSVLPAALASTATIQATNFTVLQRWLGFWARSGSYQSIGDEETYTFTNDFNSGGWFNLYYNATNYDFIITNAKAKNAGFYEAIARIMKAQNMQMLVDLYGNIPYTEAFQSGTIRTPKYDDDQAIYADLFRQLDIAIALLKDPVASSVANNAAIATNDLVFAGNALNWRRFANTLKLRMLIHTGNTTFPGGVETNTFVAGINQAAEMAIITAEGSGFLVAGVNAEINPGYNDTKPNPYFRAYIRNESGALPGLGDQTKANAYAAGTTGNVGYYRFNGDPRINRFYGFPPDPAGGTTHRGITYGEVAGNTANIGPRLSTLEGVGLVPNGAASRAWILTAAESFFLQAEAARRGLITGNAAALLTTAVRESFVFLGLTAAQADAYLLGNAGFPDVDFNGVSQGPGLPAGGIYTIISQKWFALNVIAPLEIYSDYRRTNFEYGVGGGFLIGPPISVNPTKPAAITKIPIRFFYPQNEYSFNPANVLAEGTIDVFTAGGPTGRNRIFWDNN